MLFYSVSKERYWFRTWFSNASHPHTVIALFLDPLCVNRNLSIMIAVWSDLMLLSIDCLAEITQFASTFWRRCAYVVIGLGVPLVPWWCTAVGCWRCCEFVQVVRVHVFLLRLCSGCILLVLKCVVCVVLTYYQLRCDYNLQNTYNNILELKWSLYCTRKLPINIQTSSKIQQWARKHKWNTNTSTKARRRDIIRC